MGVGVNPKVPVWCDGHEIGPPGQGRRLQGLLRTLLGLSWERRAEYDDICGRKAVCAAPPSLVIRFPRGGRWLIYSRRNELPHRSCRKQGKQAEERVKIIPAQIFTLIVSWAAIPTIKQSMVSTLTLTLDTQTALKNINCLLWLLPQVMGPCRKREPSLRALFSHASTSVYFPHLTTGGNRLVYWFFRPYTFSYSERVGFLIIAGICCILSLTCGGWGSMGHGGWPLHTLSLQPSLIPGH